jgi:hypothetical protein
MMRTILQSAALIETWFDTLEPDQRETARALRACVLTADPSLVQSIKWGNLLFSHSGRHAVAIVIHREHANLQVFNGVLLAAQFPALEGTGKGMRHLQLSYREPVDEGRVAALVRACVAEMR